MEGSFTSSDKKTNIKYYIFEPEGEIKGVVQISHGMQDYILRYKYLIRYLNAMGYVVCGNDDLGHGQTSLGKETDGFFAKKNGHKYVLADLHTMTKIAKEKYSGLPYFLLGHSMGSFFARAYAYYYPEDIDGLVLCGTSGKVKGTGFAINLLTIVKIFKGAKGKFNVIDKLMTKPYFKYIDDVKTGAEWVTRDPERLANYENDKNTRFKFTISAYKDMLKVLKFVNTNKWAKGVKKYLPIAIYSGSHDPVGNYGKGVAEVYSLLEKQKVQDLELKLYPKARHELHNELLETRMSFFSDLNAWLNKHTANKEDERGM